MHHIQFLKVKHGPHVHRGGAAATTAPLHQENEGLIIQHGQGTQGHLQCSHAWGTGHSSSFTHFWWYGQKTAVPEDKEIQAANGLRGGDSPFLGERRDRRCVETLPWPRGTGANRPAR